MTPSPQPLSRRERDFRDTLPQKRGLEQVGVRGPNGFSLDTVSNGSVDGHHPVPKCGKDLDAAGLLRLHGETPKIPDALERRCVSGQALQLLGPHGPAGGTGMVGIQPFDCPSTLVPNYAL